MPYLELYLMPLSIVIVTHQSIVLALELIWKRRKINVVLLPHVTECRPLLWLPLSFHNVWRLLLIAFLLNRLDHRLHRLSLDELREIG